MKDQLAFNEYIKELRKKAGMSTKALSLKSGVSTAYISQLESGRKDNPSPDIIRKLSDALNVQYMYLMYLAGHVTGDDLRLPIR